MHPSARSSSTASTDRRLHAALVLGFFAFYLLTGSRERPWGDAQVMWEVAVAILERGAIDIAYEWPPMSHRGADGLVYAQYPLVTSLVQVPGAWLYVWLREWWPEQQKLWWPLTSHLAPSLAAAYALGFYYRIARSLGILPRTATISTAAVGLATGLWVYARYSYSEAAQTVFFIAVVAYALRVATDYRRRDAIALGVAWGLLFNTKPTFAVAGLGFGCALVLLMWHDRRARPFASIRSNVVWGLAAFAPFIVMFALYNRARWGSVWLTGYEDTLAYVEGESPLAGAYGLLFSPGKSVFLYHPPLVVALFGWPALVRQHSRAAILVAAVTLPPLLVYTTVLNWSGGWCWGPRYWLFAVPVLALGLPFALRELSSRSRKQWLLAGVVSTVLLTGVTVQALGNLFYWDHYIRIAKQARSEWLGEPDRSGAKLPERGRGHCDSCFEDMYPLLWLPAFQPIEGHWWLAKSLAQGLDAEQAEARAPWKRYTSKRLDIERTYRRARMDWWGVAAFESKKLRPVGVGLLLGLTLVVVGAGVVASRECSRTRAAPRPRRESKAASPTKE